MFFIYGETELKKSVCKYECDKCDKALRINYLFKKYFFYKYSMLGKFCFLFLFSVIADLPSKILKYFLYQLDLTHNMKIFYLHFSMIS